jgi:hypothetical protein
MRRVTEAIRTPVAEERASAVLKTALNAALSGEILARSGRLDTEWLTFGNLLC